MSTSTSNFGGSVPGPIGQLYKRRGEMGFTRAVRQARLTFYANPNLSGLEPVECRVHPQHLIGLPAEVDGLLIVGDESVRLDHVFICCPEPVNA
jgi:hypothetical protein